MRNALNIVKGGIAKKDLTPILTHLRIANGWVTSTNGRLTIASPINGLDDLSFIVPADRFIKAVNTCKDPKIKITSTNRLSITGKGFRALLPLMADDSVFPTPEANGVDVESNDFIEVLKKLQPFIGDDASRGWSCGILLYKNIAYATNNIILVECPIQWNGPAVNLPAFLVDDLIRQRKNILSIKADRNHIMFKLEGNIWISSLLLNTSWPNVKEMLAKADFSKVKEVHPELNQAVLDILPFCPDKKFPRIRFFDEGVKTDAGDNEAMVEIESPDTSAWRAEPLLKLLAHKNLAVDFSLYPKPCPFTLPNGIKGVIVGVIDA